MELRQHPRVPPLTVRSLFAHQAPEVHSVAVDATVMDALKIMAEHDVGALAVLDHQRVVGIFSERDYARMGLLDADRADTKPVRAAMTPCEVFATPPQAVPDCLALISEKRLRYIPVLEDGKLLGLLSSGDLLHAIVIHDERVFQESELDQRILFLPGTYSC